MSSNNRKIIFRRIYCIRVGVDHNNLICEVHGGACTKVAVGGDIVHFVGLRFGRRRIRECPAKGGRSGPTLDAIINASLVLCIRAAVDGQVLGEDVDGLISRSA